VDGHIEDLYDAAHFRPNHRGAGQARVSAAAMADGYSRSGAGLGVVVATSVAARSI